MTLNFQRLKEKNYNCITTMTLNFQHLKEKKNYTEYFYHHTHSHTQLHIHTHNRGEARTHYTPSMCGPHPYCE